MKCVCFSPTAIALGSSATRFCGGSAKVPLRFFKFRGVSVSLGQIRFGLPKGSAEGSTKVPGCGVELSGVSA